MTDDDLFDNMLKTESVFKNQKSFAQNWVPEGKKLLGRENQIKKFLAIHRPIIESKGKFSTNTLVIGRGGVGKTITTRFFGRNFRRVLLKRDVKLQIEYYDCLQHRTKSSILRHISSRFQYGGGHGYSDNEIMQQILRGLKKRNESLLIILDEAHNLSSEDILSLLNASIGYGEKNSRFCIICISRPADWYKVDNEKISSRIQEKIVMKPYNNKQAKKILLNRRNIGFRDGILEDPEVELIASIVSENKNMRTGINIMRSCGIRADQLGISRIDSNMILESRSDINPTFRADVIDKLTKHEQLTLWAIVRTLKNSDNPYVKIPPTYENYQVICEELDTKAHVQMSFRKYISNLAKVKAIHKEYLNPTVEKKGRQLQVKLIDISPEKLNEYLKNLIPY